MKVYRIGLASMASFTLLAACGGGGEGPSLSLESPSAPSGKLTQKQAGMIIGPDSTVSMSNPWEMPFLYDSDATGEAVTPQFLPRTFTPSLRGEGNGVGMDNGMDPECFSLESGSDKDTDKDGVGEKRVRNISCKQFDGMITLEGRMSEWDYNDNDVLSGAKILVDSLNATIDFGEQSMTVVAAGALELKVDDTKSDFTGRMVADIEVPGQGSANFGNYSDFVITAADKSNPGHAGTANLDGYFVAKVSEGDIDVTLKITGRDLAYDHEACGNVGDYKSGRVDMVDGSQNKIAVIYENCVPRYEYNGKVIESNSSPNSAPAPRGPGRGRKA